MHARILFGKEPKNSAKKQAKLLTRQKELSEKERENLLDKRLKANFNAKTHRSRQGEVIPDRGGDDIGVSQRWHVRAILDRLRLKSNVPLGWMTSILAEVYLNDTHHRGIPGATILCHVCRQRLERKFVALRVSTRARPLIQTQQSSQPASRQRRRQLEILLNIRRLCAPRPGVARAHARDLSVESR